MHASLAPFMHSVDQKGSFTLMKTQAQTLKLVYGSASFYFLAYVGQPRDHGLRTPNEGLNQRYLKYWADVADKICFGCT